MTDPKASSDSDRSAEEAPPTQPRQIAAASLFQEAREIVIEHAGVCYRLRITRRNKLVLRK